MNIHSNSLLSTARLFSAIDNERLKKNVQSAGITIYTNWIAKIACALCAVILKNSFSEKVTIEGRWYWINKKSFDDFVKRNPSLAIEGATFQEKILSCYKSAQRCLHEQERILNQLQLIQHTMPRREYDQQILLDFREQPVSAILKHMIQQNMPAIPTSALGSEDIFVSQQKSLLNIFRQALNTITSHSRIILIGQGAANYRLIQNFDHMITAAAESRKEHLVRDRSRQLTFLLLNAAQDNEEEDAKALKDQLAKSIQNCFVEIGVDTTVGTMN